jgi:1-deoxy-D-xylulose-5-phosphate synthase
LYTAALHAGPSAIRYPRGIGPGVVVKEEPEMLPIGKAEIIEDGTDVVFLGLGALLPMARAAAAKVRQAGYSAAVINPRFVKPLDRELLARFAKRLRERGARGAERHGAGGSSRAHRMAGPVH